MESHRIARTYSSTSARNRRLFLLPFALLLSGSVLLAGESIYNLRTGQTYSRIGDAVSDSRPYDTIIVGPGSYHETVIIRHALTLQGVTENNEAPQIIPTFGAPAVTIQNPPRGSQVTVDGFTILADVPNSYAMLAEVAHATLSHNTILGTGGGIAIKTFIPDAVRIAENYISNFKSAIRIENPEERPVSDITIRSNTLDTIQDGALLYNCPSAVIESNTIKNPNDRIQFARASAITLNNCPGSQVLNNVICYFHLGIFIVKGDDILVAGNSVSRDMDTTGSGIDVASSSHVAILSNRVEEISYAIILNQVYGAEVHQNWLEDSAYGLQNGTRSDPTYQVDARDNWWGASDGPSFYGRGSGVPVNENVLFDPWLEERPDIDDVKCR